jgi:SAM-dependent methyltransferase
VTARDPRQDFGRQLHGRVLEVGPGHEPFTVAPGARVVYADKSVPGGRDATWPELAGSPRGPDADVDVDLDVDGLKAFGDASFDAVIASHVVEHLANPVAAVQELERVLRPGGRLVLVVPDRAHTFDRVRPPTTLAHLLDEHARGVTEVDDDHVREFCEAIWSQPSIHPDEVRAWHDPSLLDADRFDLHRRRSIHAHCWSPEEFAVLLAGVVAAGLARWQLEDLYLAEDLPGGAGIEFGLLLRRPRPAANEAEPTQAALDLLRTWVRLVATSPTRSHRRLDLLDDAIERDLAAAPLHLVDARAVRVGAMDHDAPDAAPRRERAHVEFPGASWTSFDRYARYGAIARAVRANLGPGEHQVLDVGDASGYLLAFDDGLRPVSVDMAPIGEPLPGARRLRGDGARLPVRDGAAAAVVSSDALEHVPPGDRDAFIAELVRVSGGCVVLAAPFDTPGVSGVEELVRRYAMFSTGHNQEQLDEHAEHGLPDLGATVASFEANGMTVATAGNGNLVDWLLMMLLKHQLIARPVLGPLDAGYDLLFNLTFADRNERPPYYRHVVVATREGTPQLGSPPEPVEGLDVDLSGVLAALIAANTTEATRQDLVNVEQVRLDIAAARTDLSSTQASLHELHDQIRSSLDELRAIRQALRHPVRAINRKLRGG